VSMEKDAKKIIEAVLAECETVCPELGQVTDTPRGEMRRYGDGGFGFAGQHFPGQYTNWDALYGALGLEARDAVAAANARAQKAIQACADYAQSVYVAKDLTISKLEAKNAALVAFVQKCATDPHEMIFLSNDYGSGGELFAVVDYEMLQKEAQQLIAANEKGGKGE
jgi:hypothetical protein